MAKWSWSRCIGDVSRLEIEANNLTIHGLEAAGEVPLAHADRLYARVRIISFVDRQDEPEGNCAVDQPVIHLIVNPDGSTNVPEPKVKTGCNHSAVQQLFDLATNRAELRDGSLIVNERKLPLDFSANDVDCGHELCTFRSPLRWQPARREDRCAVPELPRRRRQC